jgi:hypothetical protein
MAYALGAVGFGHWFERLYEGMRKNEEIRLAKVVGVSGIGSKTERLRAVGLSENEYYRIGPGEDLPQSFFDGLDIAHISNPNAFHARQTMQALSAGKITVTEKTFGIDRAEFEGVVDYIKGNGFRGKAYLHLHYVHKLLTIMLPDLLSKCTGRYGKVIEVSASFLERRSDEDLRRKGWLFSKESGGLFMDWIHPFEILYVGALADSACLSHIRQYVVNPEYGESNPTGIEAIADLKGRLFSGDAHAAIRIAKGTAESKKSVRFIFESGDHLDLNYSGSEEEFSTVRRGEWSIFEGGREVETWRPKGPDTSELLIADILEMCRGRRAGLSLEYLSKIFEPQWEYQSLSSASELEGGPAAAEFVERARGMALMSRQVSL